MKSSNCTNMICAREIDLGIIESIMSLIIFSFRSKLIIL